jgi:hypothetical protein
VTTTTQSTTIGVSCGHRVPRTPITRDGRKLYWCEDCDEWRMSGGKTTGVQGFDFLLELRDDIAVAQASGQTLVVETGEPLSDHGRRLMNTLGVPVVQKHKVATRRAHTPRPAGERRLANNADIVFVAGVEQLWHLPVAGDEQMARPTLCGLSGPVYAYGPIARQRRCCTVCAARAPRGTFLKPPPKRRPGARSVPQLTVPQIQVLHRIYVDKQLGAPAIANLVWEKLGFANPTSCANAINRSFKERGLEMRPRAMRRRSVEGLRLMGVGGRGSEQPITGPALDGFYELYRAGSSMPEIAAAHAAAYGYADITRFRSVVEYGWRACGYPMRSAHQATLLARSKNPRPCKGTLSQSNQRHRGARAGKQCPQQAMVGCDYCLAHDPDSAERRAEIMQKVHAGRPRATVPWADVQALLGPLLVPRPDRLGRHLEQAGGALARNTGIPVATCCRLLLGRKEFITEKLVNRLLAPLNLTVADLEPREAIAA